MNRRMLAFLLGMIILLFVVFPNMVAQGAKLGLTLWFHTVLPALLPFMILSNFMIKQNITGAVSRVVYPVFAKLFGLSRAGCYPAVIGLLSGYPVGAKTTAQLYREKMLSRQEAQYLLAFCNNASPMFLLEYIGIHCMGLKYPVLLLGIIYVSAWLGTFFAGRKHFYEENTEGLRTVCCERQSIIVSLDDSILDAFITITKIGGYIILFSIFAQILSDMLPLSAIIKYIGIGILEITTGGAIISKLVLEEWVQNCVLTGLCAFGGLSSVAQTASVLAGTDLSVKDYIGAKIRQAAIAILLILLLYRIL